MYEDLQIFEIRFAFVLLHTSGFRFSQKCNIVQFSFFPSAPVIISLVTDFIVAIFFLSRLKIPCTEKIGILQLLPVCFFLHNVPPYNSVTINSSSFVVLVAINCNPLDLHFSYNAIRLSSSNFFQPHQSKLFVIDLVWIWQHQRIIRVILHRSDLIRVDHL